MRITRRQLRKLIKEAMFDYRTIKKDKIPEEAIAIPEEDLRQKISKLSTQGKTVDSDWSYIFSDDYKHAETFIDALDATPAVIDMVGGYQAAALKGLMQKMHDLSVKIDAAKEQYRRAWQLDIKWGMDGVSNTIRDLVREREDVKDQIKELKLSSKEDK